MKIIDAHVHLVQYIAGTGAGGESRHSGNGTAEYASGEWFQMLPEEFSQGVVTPEDILGKTDGNGVEKTVLFQDNYFGFQNLHFLQAVARYPKRFRAAVSYDPFCRNKEQIREHLLEKLGRNIAKFEVSTDSGLMSNRFTLPLDREVMGAEYDYTDEHDLASVIDIGKRQSESWQVDRLRNTIMGYSGMKFVVCHLLAVSMKDKGKLLEGPRKLVPSNVRFDLAAFPHNCGPDAYPYPNALRHPRHEIEIAGAHKLIFGSDISSALKEDSYSNLIRYITDSHGLARKEKEMIMYRNAEHVHFQQIGGEYEI